MSEAESDAPRGRRRRRLTQLISLVGSLIGVLGLAFVVRIVVSEWSVARASITDARPAALVVAVVLGIAGMGWVGLQWRAVLAAIGSPPIGTRALLRAYFVGQLGKYVPGGIWPVLGRAEMVVRAGVPRPWAYPSVGLSMATTYVGAIVVAAAAAPFALPATDARNAWVLLVVPVGLVAIHPAVLRWLVALTERLMSRGQPLRVPSWRTMSVLIARHAPAWVLISTATWLIARGLRFDAPFAVIAFATPLAWAAGLVAVPVPGGIGVREAAFVALTAGRIDASSSATIAITARLSFVAVDLVSAGLVVASRPKPDTSALLRKRRGPTLT